MNWKPTDIINLAKQPACLFDLDGTLNHAAPVPKGLLIRGKTTDSFLSPDTLERLTVLSRNTDIILATGRGRAWVADFETIFAEAGINIAGWILEHGGVVAGCPGWTQTVLKGINLDDVQSETEKVIRKRGFPIDSEQYRNKLESFILLSGKGPLLAEHFIDCISGILGNRFRTIVGQRKIALIPKLADKYAAFEANFGDTNFIAFAAGDQADDLTILEHASFPLATSDATPVVKKYIISRDGFVSEKRGHEGTADLLSRILRHPDKRSPGFSCPELRLPYEEAEIFRPSRRVYLDLVFAKRVSFSAKPGNELLRSLAKRLDAGKKIIIEARMRDWGGESKSLVALLKVIVPLLPYARWRLVFNQNRTGVENLKTFDAILRKVSDFALVPDGNPRFSAPGVPGTPNDPGRCSAALLLFDHPDDMAPWYDLAVTRLVTRHPGEPGAWFVNPMYLKISGACDMADSGVRRTGKIMLAGSKVMMAANVIGKTDISVAVKGFQRIRSLADALIIAPRVVTNQERNRMIRDAARSTGEEAVLLSEMGQGDFPRILFVDTYGDLRGLYSQCKITYLGGGFDAGKRGFDPMESLAAGVPVISGPVYDYNRVVVNALSDTGWINILPDEQTAVENFADLAGQILETMPEADKLNRFTDERRNDPYRVAAEIMADLAGDTKGGYLFPENTVFPRDCIELAELL